MFAWRRDSFEPNVPSVPTLKRTVLFPCPLLSVIRIQLAGVETVHAQSSPLETTSNCPGPPLRSNVLLAAETETSQVDAFCTTEIVRDPTVTVPVRGVGDVLGAISSLISAEP